MILDVGTGSSSLLPALARRGQVLGIDISPAAAELARRHGFPCVAGDIFNYAPPDTFDTLIFFGNGLGMAGTPDGLDRLLAPLAGLLIASGQVLALARNTADLGFRTLMLEPRWHNQTSPAFPWLLFSFDALVKRGAKHGLTTKILARSWKYTLVRLTPG